MNAGRSSDAALYAAYPLWSGMLAAPARHMRKFVECGSAIEEPISDTNRSGQVTPVARVNKSGGRHDAELVQSIEAVRASVRRQNGRESPIGPRAERTRERLIAAADALFCEHGYNCVSAGDIAGAIGVAEPTFYQYFNGRSGVFMAVAGEHAITMISSGVRDWDPTEGEKGFRRFIENYVHLYLEDASFFSVWEEATRADPSVAALRREFFGSFKRRIASAIKRGKTCGVLDLAVSSAEAGRAIAIGIESYLFDAVIFDPRTANPNEGEIVDTLVRLWSSVLGIRS